MSQDFQRNLGDRYTVIGLADTDSLVRSEYRGVRLQNKHRGWQAKECHQGHLSVES